MTAPIIDRSDRVVSVRFLGGVTDDELRTMLDTLERYVNDETLRPAFIFDVSQGVVPPAAQRRTMGEWLRKHSASIRERCVASAYVLPNAALRGMLTAILWIAPHPIPHLVCKSAFEARAWVRSQLSRQSAPPPL